MKAKMEEKTGVILYKGYEPGGTRLECTNLADLMFLINSLDFNLVDEDGSGDGLVIFNDDWYMDIGPVELPFCDGAMAIYHYITNMDWQFGLGRFITYCPYDWTEDIQDVKRAVAWLARHNFDDDIVWDFGVTQKYRHLGWFDVKITHGDPFAWMCIKKGE